ncbi:MULTISPECIES: hypothetical protein [Sutcliffiella]|uniref:hypothetical protein n=1 Tax=Sutcliffiella TaxID=2837511 RepID=UPI0022DE2F77|nr:MULTISPECIES: hypothetical protein [Sutcliffiella]MED4016697.1 hypothetical protein [Sutcliffiella cohnii]WBL14333.1 hypothetical protein O1A01_21000 [Sutcliffiella sp. NC1]
MKFIKIVIATCLLAVSLLSLAPSTFACSCLPPGTPSEELASHDAVFAGKVLNIKEKGEEIEVTIEVSEAWKGMTNKETTVYTPSNSAACGVNFETNIEYIIYANNDNGELHTNLCSRTAELAFAQEDVAELGEGTPLNSLSAKDNEGNFTTNFGISMLVLIGLGSFWFVSKRKKK